MYMTLTSEHHLHIGEGPAYEYQVVYEDDAPETRVRFDYLIEVETPTGRVFCLNHGFRTREDAAKMISKIKAHGVLNLDHWHETEILSLEEKFVLYAENEAEVRAGYRLEEDMYHGL